MPGQPQRLQCHPSTHLPGHVHSSKVIPRVRFCEPALFRNRHDVGKALPGLELVEYIGQCPREDALDPQDAVACLEQVLKRRDDRKSCPNCCLSQRDNWLGSRRNRLRHRAAQALGSKSIRPNISFLLFQKDSRLINIDTLKAGGVDTRQSKLLL